MASLSDLVERDYDEEIKIIQEAGGNLWLTGLGTAFILAVMCGCDWLFNNPWTKKDFAGAIAFVVVFPFVIRFWERHKVAAEMRHEREVRMEVKLNVLLGLVKISSDD
jgi:hypothetical protein